MVARDKEWRNLCTAFIDEVMGDQLAGDALGFMFFDLFAPKLLARAIAQFGEQTFSKTCGLLAIRMFAAFRIRRKSGGFCSA